jgi:hypothetical protein
MARLSLRTTSNAGQVSHNRAGLPDFKALTTLRVAGWHFLGRAVVVMKVLKPVRSTFVMARVEPDYRLKARSHD